MSQKFGADYLLCPDQGTDIISALSIRGWDECSTIQDLRLCKNKSEYRQEKEEQPGHTHGCPRVWPEAFIKFKEYLLGEDNFGVSFTNG